MMALSQKLKLGWGLVGNFGILHIQKGMGGNTLALASSRYSLLTVDSVLHCSSDYSVFLVHCGNFHTF